MMNVAVNLLCYTMLLTMLINPVTFSLKSILCQLFAVVCFGVDDDNECIHPAAVKHNHAHNSFMNMLMLCWLIMHEVGMSWSCSISAVVVLTV
jgi:hypothetical protein